MKRMEKNNLVWYMGEDFSAPDIVHGFTTRLGGVSQGDLSSLNLGTSRGDDPKAVAENYKKVYEALGISPLSCARNAQIHGDTIHVITQENSYSMEEFIQQDLQVTQGDGLVTDCTDIGLWVYGADCVPVLFAEPERGVIAALHGGWRGTALGISGKMIETMVEKFSCEREKIQVVIGPSIGPCCFTCGEEVVTSMEDTFGEKAKKYCPPHSSESGKFSVDLQGLHTLSLQQAGVTKIELVSPCTACDTETFWSHRKMGEARGIQGGFIYRSPRIPICQE